jgi:hypothetical protein
MMISSLSDRAKVLHSYFANNSNTTYNGDWQWAVGINGSNAEVAYNTLIGPGGSAVEIDGQSVVNGGSLIHHNLIQNFTDGSEISHTHDTSYWDNLFVNDSNAAINIHGDADGLGPVTNTSFYNNTVWFTGTSSQGFVCVSVCTLRNNIIHATMKAGFGPGYAGSDYNLYDCTGCVYQFTLGPHDIVGPAGLTSPPTDLHPTATSSAVNSGTPLTTVSDDYDQFPRPYSSTYDRGAYEWHP